MEYDGYDFKGLLKVEGVSRRLVPTVTVPQMSYDAIDGGLLGRATLAAAQIDVAVRVFMPVGGYKNQDYGLEQKRRTLAGLLFRRDPRPLVLDQWPDVTYMAVLSGDTDLERVGYTEGTTLHFLCEEPAGWGAKREFKNTDSTTFTVGGNYPTYPVITVEADGYSVDLEIDGRHLRTVGEYADDGAPFVFDCEAEECSCGQYYVPVNVMDDYPRLEPGTHTVECGSPVTVEWRERWI